MLIGNIDLSSLNNHEKRVLCLHHDHHDDYDYSMDEGGRVLARKFKQFSQAYIANEWQGLTLIP